MSPHLDNIRAHHQDNDDYLIMDSCGTPIYTVAFLAKGPSFDKTFTLI